MNLGRYSLINKIAEGGISDIYLAKTAARSGDENYLVCKCIKKSCLNDAEVLSSLKNEAEILVQLRHPNIIQVFDLCEEQGITWMTMEYMDSENLFRLLIMNRAMGMVMPYEVAIYVIGKICLGLHAAHEMRDFNGNALNLVHRDISPENILFNTNGDIKISDFGIAKTANMADITPKETIKGKFNYMSPDQAWGDKVDRRSDIFSVAILLYECLLGQSMYPSGSVANAISSARMAIYETPRNLMPDFPEDLENILKTALDVDKNKRYQTALEFKTALDKCAQDHGWNITRSEWIEYLRERIKFPNPVLPMMQAEEILPDPSSVLSNKLNSFHDPFDPTGQLGVSEINRIIKPPKITMAKPAVSIPETTHRAPEKPALEEFEEEDSFGLNIDRTDIITQPKAEALEKAIRAAMQAIPSLNTDTSNDFAEDDGCATQAIAQPKFENGKLIFENDSAFSQTLGIASATSPAVSAFQNHDNSQFSSKPAIQKEASKPNLSKKMILPKECYDKCDIPVRNLTRQKPIIVHRSSDVSQPTEINENEATHIALPAEEEVKLGLASEEETHISVSAENYEETHIAVESVTDSIIGRLETVSKAPAIQPNHLSPQSDPLQTAAPSSIHPQSAQVANNTPMQMQNAPSGQMPPFDNQANLEDLKFWKMMTFILLAVVGVLLCIIIALLFKSDILG